MKYEQGKQYLVKCPTTGYIRRVTILDVTDTCYHIQWDTGARFWFEIPAFERDNRKLEELKPSLKQQLGL